MADSERQLLDELPNEVQSIDDIDRVKKDFEKKLRKKDTGFFAGLRKWDYQRQIDKFENNENNPFHAGTKGEKQVISELMKLDDNYHILCGVRLELPHYVSYDGIRNLKSAQMDVIVVCPKGVFMIEVKNWSDGYVQNYDDLNPYEQTGRAGRILWITLQDVISDIRVTNVLLSIRGNIPYNQKYRMVLVSSLSKINSFLEKRSDTLNSTQIEILVDSLKYDVTT